MIRAMRVFAATFLATLAREILPRPAPQTTGDGKWGDLIDPPLPCGKCNLDCDECPCLEATFSKVSVNGYSVDQLYRDIEELEHGSK